MGHLGDFLQKNSVVASETLPLIHTTASNKIRGIVKGDAILPQLCTVFNENLIYFFVGRPAYKYVRPEKIAKYWELPCCFIFNLTSVNSVRRVYPFDSGAFDRGLYPSYMNMLNLDDLEVSAVTDAPWRLIGAFFGNKSSYMQLEGRSKKDFEFEFSPSVFEHEASALAALANEGSSVSFDDRRFSVEIQSQAPVNFSSDPPIAVVAPSIYFDDQEFFDRVVNQWGAQPITYRISTLSIDQYYGQIYDKIAEFYESRGIM